MKPDCLGCFLDTQPGRPSRHATTRQMRRDRCAMNAVALGKLVDGRAREVVLHECGHLDGGEKSLKNSNSPNDLAP